MKKITFLTLIALITLSFTLSAQDYGKIIIHNASDAYPKFIISMNGIRLTNDYNNSVTFNYVDEVNYRVKILQSGSTGVLNFNITSSPNYVTKYLINKDNYGNYSLILESKYLLSAEPVTPNTNTVVVSTPTISTPQPATVVVTPTVAPTSTITNMDAEDFKSRLAAVNKEHFDKEKLERCKEVFDDQYFSTSQVAEVMKSFPFDDGKVSFAKWAYKNTLDKKNYYKLSDLLTFSSSKKELADYVKKQPKE